MDDPLAVALKFGFLAVLYLFLLWVSRSALRDLARSRDSAVAAEPVGPPSASQRHEERHGGRGMMENMRPRLEVIAALGYQPGTVFDISSGATMGRADSAEIPIDDPFASSAHARIYARGDFMHVEDMGSTNGTYLNRQRITSPAELQRGDRLKIGKTVLELRK